MFKRNTLITAALLLFSFQAFAQPGIDVNDATGQIGMQVVVNVDYLSDGNEQNLQFDIDYDAAILSVNSCIPNAMNTAGGTTTATCQDPGPDNANSLRFLTVNLTGNIDAGTQSVAVHYLRHQSDGGGRYNHADAE